MAMRGETALTTNALPVLYTFRRCPYAMRARLAIAVSGLQVEQREVALRNKPAELLAASPKATVPVLVLPNGEVIDESLDVMLWALAQHDPEHWLTPERGGKDAMLALIRVNDMDFKQNLDRYKYPHRYTSAMQQEPADAASFALAHRTAGAERLLRLEALLGQGWLCGARASLADMAILPFVRQFAHTDKLWFAEQQWPALQAWLQDFEGSTMYQGVMQKNDPWPAAGL